MKTYCIYKHTNSITGKSYIGQTCKRKRNYRWGNGSGYVGCIKFYRAIQKYTWASFTHDILEDNIQTLNEANQKEIYYIKLYNSYLNGYNNDEGGNSSAYLRRPIYQLDVNKNIVKEWNAISDAEDSLNIFNISACCNSYKKQLTSGGYYWCFVEDYSKYQLRIPKTSPKPHKIYMLDKNKLILEEFNSVVDACNKYKILHSNIISCCKGRRRECNGYYWCYIEDYENYIIKDKYIKRISQYSLDNKFIRSWESARVIERELGLPHTPILNCCKHRYNTAYKFKWVFEEEITNEN